MINIKTDSRKVKPGDIFVAVKCEVNDGHQYIEQAIEKGASKVVAERGNYNISTEIVSNTRKYLNKYLDEHYNKYLDEMKIIGLTGTNGKTTTAFLIYEALNKLGIKCAYIGTIGYYLSKKVRSLPNTNPDICDMYDMIIEAYDKGYRHIVIEASSQGIEGKRLDGITFDYAIFTNLTQDHLDYHKTMSNYALAKQKLFKKLKKNGKAIVNIDGKYKDYFLLKENSNITYGFGESDYKIIDYATTITSTQFTYEHNKKTYELKSSLIAKYNIPNILATVILLENLGIKNEQIKEVIPKLKSPLGRMEKIKYNKNMIIIDYAHTPDALFNIMDSMKHLTKGNLYAVFGCTGDRDRLKRPIMTRIATNICKKVIITIDDLHNEDPNQIVDDMLDGLENTNYEVCLDRKRAIIRGIKELKEHDTLLILGKGHEEFIISGNKRIPFNDKQTVLDYLEEISTVK